MGIDNQEEHIKTLLGCFCELLLQSDVSAYQKSHTKKNNMNQYNQFFESAEEQASQVSIKNATNAPLPKFINQENDIVQIVNGFKTIINHCLKIKTDDAENEEENVEEMLKDLGKQPSNETGGWNFWPWGTGKREAGRPDQDSKNREVIFAQIQQILLGCLNCWNDIDSFKARDYYFTRMGSFSYNPEDDRLMDRKIGKYLQSMNVIADNEEALTKKESFVNTKQGDRRMTAAFNKQGPRKTSLKPQANT